jgi:hypothetical protein
VREKRCRSRRLSRISHRDRSDSTVRIAKRAALRNVFGSPPASTVFELPSVLGGLRGWPRRLCIPLTSQHFGWSWLIPFALCNCAGPQHFCHLRGLLRVGARNHAGRLVWEVKPSLPVLLWPPQTSVPPLYYVTAVTARAKRGSFDAAARVRVRADSRTRPSGIRRCLPPAPAVSIPRLLTFSPPRRRRRLHPRDSAAMRTAKQAIALTRRCGENGRSRHVSEAARSQELFPTSQV